MTVLELPPTVSAVEDHPAKFSQSIMEHFVRLLADELKLAGPGLEVLDPFAGTGRVHELALPGELSTVGVEIEPEWAALHPDTIVGDATCLPPEWTGRFDAVITSPAYGNRMADQYLGDANGSRRHTYATSLGRKLDPRSGARLQWGDHYRELHRQAWDEALRVLVPCGLMVVNVSDHIRGGQRMSVVEWHRETLSSLGFVHQATVDVETPRNRHGANHDLRVDSEAILVFRAPAAYAG